MTRQLIDTPAAAANAIGASIEADRSPFVNEITTPFAPRAVQADTVQSTRLLARRNARWARRANRG